MTWWVDINKLKEGVKKAEEQDRINPLYQVRKNVLIELITDVSNTNIKPFDAGAFLDAWIDSYNEKK